MSVFDYFRRAIAPKQKRPKVEIRHRIMQSANTGRLEASWGSTPTTADALVYRYWTTLVARSRQMAEDADHMKKFLQLVRDNVAGHNGFRLNAQVRDLDGTSDYLASKAIEEGYAEWSKPTNYDVSGQLSRTDVERLAVMSAAKDGEVIAIKRYGKHLNPWGYAIQLVDPVLLDPTHYKKLRNGTCIRHGIEMDEETNRPIAYYFKQQDEEQIGYISHSGNKYTRVPAENVIHWFLPEIVGQKRGLPWARTSLWRMRMLSGFEDAAVTNARIGAAKMGFFRDPNAETDEDEEIPMEAEPGIFEDIGGREFVQFDPNYPNGEFDPFVKSCLRSIASGLNVSYNNLASDLSSVNFSSLRQGALDEREVWKGLQESFIARWAVPVFEGWLERALLSEKLKIKGKPLRYERIEKYKQVSFMGRRWPWIDPAAESTANEKAVALRVTSRSQIIRDAGGDPEDVWTEIEREEAEMDQRCITLKNSDSSERSETEFIK